MKAITVGLDVARSVFQVHVEDEEAADHRAAGRRSQVEKFLAHREHYPN